MGWLPFFKRSKCKPVSGDCSAGAEGAVAGGDTAAAVEPIQAKSSPKVGSKRRRDAGAAAAPYVNAYEAERLARIARNKAMMEQLEIPQAAAELARLSAAPRPKKQCTVKCRTEQGPKEPAKRSSRLANMERPDYCETNIKLYIEEEREPRVRAKAKTKTGSRKRLNTGGDEDGFTGQYPAWHPYIPTPPAAAADAAKEAARRKQQELQQKKKPVMLKTMTPSMISGGFWLSWDSRAQLQNFLEVGFVAVTCHDETRPASTFQYCKDDGTSWTMNALEKKAGEQYGFSGGWRGFAIDQWLHVDDVVVFEVTSRTSVTAHIFRAWDYAAATDRPADLDTVRFKRITLGELLKQDEAAGVVQPAAGDAASTDTVQPPAEQAADDLQPAAKEKKSAKHSRAGKTAKAAVTAPSKRRPGKNKQATKAAAEALTAAEKGAKVHKAC